MFTIGPASRVLPKTLKMVLDTSLLNTQQYEVRIKGKVEHTVLSNMNNPKIHLFYPEM